MKPVNHANYQLVHEEYVNEIKSDATLYTHGSGARVLFLVNDDDNKVFNISFKTPPEDDMGIAHIMEHSVLCGSKKYPVKEPFVELMKSSLNTFLNAMTYPDKTIYPVASQNHADFRNLVDVYLDAVFEPELSREAFEQEGWHYEVEEDNFVYKGVVFNEMKGVFSASESYLDLATNRALFPDSSYKYESGGYPPAITDLSYEEYLQFHREKYHPANSWIILYGDLKPLEWLEYLDNEYLCHFSAPEFKLPEIICQTPFSEPVEIDCFYPASAEDSDGSLLALSFLIGDSTDLEQNFAMGVLDNILIGDSASPLKKALLESGLGQDTLDYGYSAETLQTTWSVGLRDATVKNKTKFVDLVFSTLQKICTHGFPEKVVSAAMNSCEFQLREANFGSYPKGLVYSMNIMSRWLYGASPLAGLQYEPLLKNLKEKIAAGGYFEKLIRQNLLDNKHYVVSVCSPDKNMGSTLEEQELQKLHNAKKSFSADDLFELKEKNAILTQRQMTPDSPEALATIPHVSLADLKKEIDPIPTENMTVMDRPLLYHDLDSQGICYLNLIFDCNSLCEDELPWLSLLSNLFVKCGTKDTAYDNLTQDIACHTGGLNCSVNTFSTYLRDTGTGVHLNVQAKVMKGKRAELFRLINSVMFDVDFKDIQRLKELIGSMRSKLKNSLQNNGDRVARNQISAALSNTGYISSLISGQNLLEFLNTIAEKLNEDAGAVVDKLLSLKKKILSREKLTINISADKDVMESIKQPLNDLVKLLPVLSCTDAKINNKSKGLNLGMISSGSVQYVVKGTNILHLETEVTGSFELLSQLLSTGYLWEKVRVQGGAYGCFMNLDKISGDLMISSYRDPNLQETLQAYDAIADFLEQLELSDEELEKLIIGTVGRIDSPLTTPQKSNMALNRFLVGVDHEKLNRKRKELLATTNGDLKKYIPFFRELAQKGQICVHGVEKRLLEAKELFDKVITINK
jgi:presequence protease